MAESAFPGIDSKSVHDRVKAVQMAALEGRVDDIPMLLGLAQKDKSPGVRLGAAAAAADILSRYRTGEAAASFTIPQKLAVLGAFKGLDPGINPALFQVLGALGGKKALGRLKIGVRDPRYDVRNGAIVGLLRYCSSLAVAKDEAVRDTVIGLLDDDRLRPDSRAGIILICASCGWSEARGRIEAELDREDQVGQAAAAAVERLDYAADPTTMAGSWYSSGLDAGEINPGAGISAWLLLHGELGLIGAVGELSPIRWRMEGPAHLRIRRGNERVDWDVRRMWLSPGPDQPEAGALQFEGRMWYPATIENLLELSEVLLDSGGGVDRRRREEVVALVLPMLPDTEPGRRAAALLELSVGHFDESIELLSAMMAKKKAAVELHFFLGEALSGAGREDEARKSWQTYIDQAGKRGPHLTKARRRLEK